LLSKIIDETNLDIDYAILSGPSFAAEVASGKPTALVLASKSLDLAEKIAEDLIFKQFRLYLSDDVIGVQVGAAIKNVYAIGSGIVEGINYGKSANAAFIARAIVEMSRFCIAVGGRKETIFGLSGLGDAILTCNSELSRNFILGRRIGIGHHINRIMKENLTVAEGYFTIKAINKIAISNSIDMPILSAIYSIIHENMDPIIVADRLLSRPKKEEDVI
jgi:glycerol-3-phosphate dehydrogenase (NAD(P)+)